MNNVRLLWGLVGGLLLLLGVVGRSWIKHAEDLQTVAVVDGASITEADWLQELKRQYGREVLDEMINRQVVLREAKRLGITVDPRRVQAEVDRIRVGYGREQDLPAALKEHGELDVEAVKRDVEYRLLLEAIATKDIAVREEEIRTYYEQHQSDFRQPASAHVWQIVVASREEAEEIRREVNDGADFAALARKRSLDSSAPRGGDLGWVSLEGDDLPDGVREAALAVPVGGVSGPVKVDNGFAVVLVTERKEAVEPSFEDVKEQIRQELALAQVSLDDVLARLRKQAGVKVTGDTAN